ncbi:hypothetical protein LCGC14_2968110 [marine sediment metagenome]|uniref:Uncharacterized protein n=1 Tax=marine sediment metagenome TaxID=412755 RepID=A0A0F8XB51_9ZZZZ
MACIIYFGIVPGVDIYIHLGSIHDSEKEIPDMKIIGSGECDNFILSAGRQEVLRILGYKYPSSNGAPQLQIGMDIPVSPIYKYLHELWLLEGTLHSIKKRIEGDVFTAITLPPELVTIRKKLSEQWVDK